MLPQSISIAWFTFNTQTFLIALAAMALCAVAWLQQRDRRVPMNAVVLTICALVAGRAGFVILNWHYFSERPTEIMSLAGISEHAAIAGALFGYWLLAKLNQPLSTLHFPLATALLLIGIAASVGCIPNGCAFGREVFWQTDGAGSLAWLLRADWPDNTLTRSPRWPAQALLAGWLVLGLALLVCMTRQQVKSLPSLVMPIVVLWLVVGDFMVQLSRGDTAFMLAGMRIFQVFDVMLAGFSILWLTRQILRKH